MVHFRAVKNVCQLTDEQLPKVKNVIRQRHLLLPRICCSTVAFGYSPTMAVFWSIVSLVVASWLGDKEHRMTPEGS